MATQEIIEGGFQFAGAIVGDALGGMLQGADIQVVLQVPAHVGRIHGHIDAVGGQIELVMTGRQGAQLRRVLHAEQQQMHSDLP